MERAGGRRQIIEAYSEEKRTKYKAGVLGETSVSLEAEMKVENAKTSKEKMSEETTSMGLEETVVEVRRTNEYRGREREIYPDTVFVQVRALKPWARPSLLPSLSTADRESEVKDLKTKTKAKHSGASAKREGIPIYRGRPRNVADCLCCK